MVCFKEFDPQKIKLTIRAISEIIICCESESILLVSNLKVQSDLEVARRKEILWLGVALHIQRFDLTADSFEFPANFS